MLYPISGPHVRRDTDTTRPSDHRQRVIDEMFHVILMTFFFHHWVWHPLIGKGYQFWSGVEPDVTQLAIVGGIISIVGGFWHQHNCHVQRCYRLQFHPHPNHGHPVCKKHFKEDVQNLEDH